MPCRGAFEASFFGGKDAGSGIGLLDTGKRPTLAERLRMEIKGGLFGAIIAAILSLLGVSIIRRLLGADGYTLSDLIRIAYEKIEEWIPLVEEISDTMARRLEELRDIIEEMGLPRDFNPLSAFDATVWGLMEYYSQEDHRMPGEAIWDFLEDMLPKTKEDIKEIGEFWKEAIKTEVDSFKTVYEEFSDYFSRVKEQFVEKFKNADFSGAEETARETWYEIYGKARAFG
ncbi:MAG: hypothetical protein DRP09_15375 [Candidatus Thorarchaeota archaeon]|nr:MAG: hypothetical protein DRP09_15375 [Candidatus Thorarchaeota archaeon]